MMGQSTFYVNFGRYLNLFNTSRKLLQTKIILRDVSQLKELYEEILKNIKYY